MCIRDSTTIPSTYWSSTIKNILVCIFCIRTTRTVSYTHLDVYKRQVPKLNSAVRNSDTFLVVPVFLPEISDCEIERSGTRANKI